MVHECGPTCASQSVGCHEKRRQIKHLGGLESLAWNPSSPARHEFPVADQRLRTRSLFEKPRWSTTMVHTRLECRPDGTCGGVVISYIVFSLPLIGMRPAPSGDARHGRSTRSLGNDLRRRNPSKQKAGRTLDQRVNRAQICSQLREVKIARSGHL
jgi:hypothetical protein